MNLSYIKALIWAVVIFIGSSISGDTLNGIPLINIPGFDKMVHFLWYFVLCLLILAGVRKHKGKLTFWQMSMITVICILYGGLLEILQGNIFNERSQDIYDFIANCSGALIASFSFLWLYKKSFWRKIL